MGNEGQSTGFNEALPGFLILGAIAFTIWRLLWEPMPCLEYKKIEAVGGCDSWQGCGVRFTDGTSGTARTPVQGQRLCTSKASFFSFQTKLVAIEDGVFKARVNGNWVKYTDLKWVPQDSMKRYTELLSDDELALLIKQMERQTAGSGN